MRILGNHLFDLKLHDVFLPNHTIERDKFDILNVVRNIPTFVNSFKYNILNQRFLQITGENKIISCISIQQLSDSIRTHGLGILSTTVNAFYKYMVGYFFNYIAKYKLLASFCLWTIYKICSIEIENGSKNTLKRKIIQDSILMKEPNIYTIKLKSQESLKMKPTILTSLEISSPLQVTLQVLFG